MVTMTSNLTSSARSSSSFSLRCFGFVVLGALGALAGCGAIDIGSNTNQKGALSGGDGGGGDSDGSTSVLACGTRGAAACAAGLTCIFPTGECGATDKGGLCVAVNDACDEIYAPVCGCDGKTYPNECDAHRAGASVQSIGLCAGDPCDIRGGGPCAAGLACIHPIEGACGAADVSGKCMAPPENCATISDPVCGCDGKTYGNECMANTEGVSAKSKGACP